IRDDLVTGVQTCALPISSLTTNDLTLTAGTFNAPATLDINGNTLITTGTFNAGTTITAGGNWTNNASASAFVPGSGTVTFDSTRSEERRVGKECETAVWR